jgi:hypothetical protein
MTDLDVKDLTWERYRRRGRLGQVFDGRACARFVASALCFGVALLVLAHIAQGIPVH